MRRGALAVVALGAVAAAAFGGCGAPFNEVKPSEAQGGVRVVYCGSSAASAQSVMNAMEPPVGQLGASDLPAEKELDVCLRLENHGGDTARLDRTALLLKCPRETDDPQADRDDQEVIAHPGESKEFHVTFHYTQLPSGEDVSLKLDRALRVGDKPVKLPPIALRKR